jgi:hypothetical protein
MAYTPPTGSAINFTSSGAYTPPAGDEIYFGGSSGPLFAELVQVYDLERFRFGVELRQYYGDVPVYSAALVQRYGNATVPVYTLLNQPYGELLSARLRQLYGDVPVLSSLLHQYYQDRPMLSSRLRQRYGDLQPLGSLLSQPYLLRAGLSALLHQPYVIAGAVLGSRLNQPYDLEARNRLASLLRQPYAIIADETPYITITPDLFGGTWEADDTVTIVVAGGTATVTGTDSTAGTIADPGAVSVPTGTPAQTWTATFTGATSYTLTGSVSGLVGSGTITTTYAPTDPSRSGVFQQPAISVTANGLPISPYRIELMASSSEGTISAEIYLADQGEWLVCRHLDSLTLTIDGDEYQLMIEAPRATRSGPDAAEYVIPAISPTVLLEAPYAATINRTFSAGMASTLVTDLAAEYGVTVDWQLVDWHIPAGILYALDETPGAVIGKVVAAVRGIKQTAPDGTLVCMAEYPVSPPDWASSPPAAILTDMDDFYSRDSVPEIRDGWNRFVIGNANEGADLGIRLEQETIDANTVEVRLYQVPLVESEIFPLQTSGGGWVGITAYGLTSEAIVDEQVEIVGGEGDTRYPIYGSISYRYREATLGAITPGEDGHLTTETPGQSLVLVNYTTRYRRWLVTSPNVEEVQFFVEEADA